MQMYVLYGTVLVRYRRGGGVSCWLVCGEGLSASLSCGCEGCGWGGGTGCDAPFGGLLMDEFEFEFDGVVGGLGGFPS